MRSQKMKLLTIAALLLAVLFAVRSMTPATAQQSDATEAVTATVAAGINLNVRDGPGLQYPAFTTLAGGQSVALIGRDSTGAWIQVRLADGRIGWSSSQFLESASQFDALPLAGAPPDVPSTTAPGVGGLAQGTVTNASVLNVRTGPGLDANLLTTLALSQTVTLEGRDAAGAWLQVRLPDDRLGWVSREFITPNLDIATLPVTSPVTTTTPGVGGLAQGTVTNANLLNVRSGPGLNFAAFATLPLNQAVTLEGRDANSSWLQVRLPDNRLGWVSSEFIIPNLDVATLPVTAPAETPVDATSPVTPTTPAAETEPQTFDLNVRTGPGLNYPVLMTLPEGETVELQGRNADGSWLLIRMPDGEVGWINRVVIATAGDLATLPETAPVAEAETPAVGGLATGTVVNANLLNVRSGPGLNATILTTLPLGESVVLEGRNADSSWLQVRLADGRLGWVSSEFITANLNIANLPVTG